MQDIPSRVVTSGVFWIAILFWNTYIVMSQWSCVKVLWPLMNLVEKPWSLNLFQQFINLTSSPNPGTFQKNLEFALIRVKIFDTPCRFRKKQKLPDCSKIWSRVELVHNYHPRDPEFVAVFDRWSFFRGSFMLWKLKIGPQTGDHCWHVVVTQRWSLAQVWL